MPSLIFVRRLMLVGTAASVFGIVLSQLDLLVLTIAPGLSILATLLGLLTTLIGATLWAWRAPLRHLLVSEASAGVAAFLVGRLADINIREPTVVFLFVVIAAALGSAVILLIAFRRFA